MRRGSSRAARAGWGDLAPLLRGLGFSPARAAEREALDELRAGDHALELSTILGYASAAHRAYRQRGLRKRAINTIFLAHANDIVVVRHPDHDTPVAERERRLIFCSLNPYPFDVAHETAEVLVGHRGTHTDVQALAIALLVERSEAQRVSHLGLGAGLRALQRVHRRVPPWCLAVRLVMASVAEDGSLE